MSEEALNRNKVLLDYAVEAFESFLGESNFVIVIVG
jgi:hypothetical protein